MFTISFDSIKNSKQPLVHLDHDLAVRPEFLERGHELLLDLKSAQVEVDAFYQEPFVVANYHVSADLVVPSSRSLAPVAIHEDFTFTENYLDRKASAEEAEEVDFIVQIPDGQIDLQEAVEDNILLHIPTTGLTPEEKSKNIFPAGQGWEVISEAEFESEQEHKPNPAFAKLKDLLKNEDQGDD
ncbi:YceD family protein [Lactobacillus corticis]|uniref:DNA-binding protein n=1 Tax=Lactobacillus corticis TaxID=2201249 RepID=A0A916QJW1_9LACO|nr:YceD family protein [Lactobacillus corticis]GFZ26680.1 DNA-binding protein [Lactobacillus corticis]